MIEKKDQNKSCDISLVQSNDGLGCERNLDHEGHFKWIGRFFKFIIYSGLD